MICPALIPIVGSSTLLRKGALHELRLRRPESKLSNETFHMMNQGKDEAIIHMLSGGNGFPERQPVDYVERAMFDAGVSLERRDLRAIRAWEQDLTQALSDRKRGRCS